MQLPKNKASQLRHIKRREPERVGAQYTLMNCICIIITDDLLPTVTHSSEPKGFKVASEEGPWKTRVLAKEYPSLLLYSVN